MGALGSYASPVTGAVPGGLATYQRAQRVYRYSALPERYHLVAGERPRLPRAAARPPAHAAEDFTGDGKADLLWRNNDGSVVAWQMNGAIITSGASLANPSLANPSLDWHLT